MSDSPFGEGEQVWVLTDGEWWPAKICNPALYGVDTPSPTSVFVQYYGSQDFGFVDYDPETLSAFETASEKAETSNQRILEAIAAALADPEGTVPDQQLVPPSAADMPAAKKQRTERKRADKKKTSTAADKPKVQAEEPKAEESDLPLLADKEAMEMKNELEAAVAAQDLTKLRKTLVFLARHQVSYELLLRTKVGVAVGNLLATPSFKPVYPIARCILRSWVRALPEETLKAMGEVNRRAVAARHKEPEFPQHTAPGGSVKATGPTVAGSTSRSAFEEKIMQLFLKDGDGVEELTAYDIAHDFENVSVSREMRQKVVLVLSEPSHTALRRRLLDRDLSAEKFFSLTERELEAPALKDARDAKEKERVRIEEETAKTLHVISEMYECPRCKKRRTTFHEKQIRSGDEPATIFIKCMECGLDWTLN